MINSYIGVHQWDFTTNDNMDLIVIRRNDEYINFSEMFRDCLDIKVWKRPTETALFVEHEGYRDDIIADITKIGNIKEELLNKYDDVYYSAEVVKVLFEKLLK